MNRFNQDVKKILCEERQKNWSRQLKLILLTLILSYSSFFIEFYYENNKSDEEKEKKLKGILYYFFIFGFSKGNNSNDSQETFNLLFDLYGYVILLIFLFFESFLLKWFDNKYGLNEKEEESID